MALVVGEGSVKEGVHNLESQTLAQHSCAQSQHVRIVVLTGGGGGEAVGAEGGGISQDQKESIEQYAV